MILTAKSVLRYLFILIISCLFLVYIFSQSERYLKGPSLIITYPENGTSTTSQDIIIAGEAQRISFLALNNMQIFATDEGYFEERLLLSPGYNIIDIKVTDRFERERTERLHITYIDKKSDDELSSLSLTGTTSPPLLEGDVPVSSNTTTLKGIINDNN